MSSEGSTGEQRAENAPAYKSTPLRPAIIMTTVLVWALVVTLIVRVPSWASIFLAVLTGASFLVFLGGYLYLFTMDRESLRTGRKGRGEIAAKPSTKERGTLAAGSSMPVGARESSGIPVSETKRVGERRPYQGAARPNNGMHPTENSAAFMRETMLLSRSVAPG